MDNYYYEQIKNLNRLKVEAESKQDTFFQQLLIVSSTLLGLIVSLHTTNSPLLYIRLVYVAALALLSLGVLATAVAVYGRAKTHALLAERFQTELNTALHTDRQVEPVYTRHSKVTLFCQKASLLLLVVGVLLLACYGVQLAV